jgi:PadR family transcriptional regulator PadR
VYIPCKKKIMLSRHNVGEFEEVVMLTIGILGESAYGLAIKSEIEQRLKRRVSMGALHTGLYRLEEKGYLKSKLGEATNVRGGKPKRFFKVTGKGQKVLKHVMEQRQNLWRDIPESVFKIFPG